MRTVTMDKPGQEVTIETQHGTVTISNLEGELRVRVKNDRQDSEAYFLSAQIGVALGKPIIHQRTWAALDVRHAGHVRIDECTGNKELAEIVNAYIARRDSESQSVPASAGGTPDATKC